MYVINITHPNGPREATGTQHRSIRDARAHLRTRVARTIRFHLGPETAVRWKSDDEVSLRRGQYRLDFRIDRV